MCIAIWKPEGADLLSKDMYEQCWKLNDDGASISYWNTQDKLWNVVKGLMTFEDWWKVYCDMRNDGRIGKDVGVFIHFRVGTAGPKMAGALTHPFPVTDNYDDMRETMFAARNIIAHNGTIGPGDKDKSDTMMGVMRYIQPLWDLAYYKNGKVRNERLEFIMKECLDTAVSRWFIANGPNVTLYGPWIFDQMYDTHFSNTDYDGPWYGYGGAYGTGWGTGYADSAMFIEPQTAKFIRQGELSTYLDEQGCWDWDAWNDMNGIFSKTTASGNDSSTDNDTHNVSDDEQSDDNGLVMAIIDEDGIIQWNDEYEKDDDLLCCPDCAGDNVFAYKHGVATHACWGCGCLFNEEGDTFGNSKDVTEMDWGECMYCNEEVLIETSGHCTQCGAMLDIKEVGHGRN